MFFKKASFYRGLSDSSQGTRINDLMNQKNIQANRKYFLILTMLMMSCARLTNQPPTLDVDVQIPKINASPQINQTSSFQEFTITTSPVIVEETATANGVVFTTFPVISQNYSDKTSYPLVIQNIGDAICSIEYQVATSNFNCPDCFLDFGESKPFEVYEERSWLLADETYSLWINKCADGNQGGETVYVPLVFISRSPTIVVGGDSVEITYSKE